MPLKYSKACHFSSPKKRHQPINQKLARLMTWGHQQPVPTRNACIPGQQQVEAHFHPFPNPHFRPCFMIGENSNRWHSASRRLRLFIANAWVPKYMEISDYPFGGCHSLWGPQFRLPKSWYAKILWSFASPTALLLTNNPNHPKLFWFCLISCKQSATKEWPAWTEGYGMKDLLPFLTRPSFLPPEQGQTSIMECVQTRIEAAWNTNILR